MTALTLAPAPTRTARRHPRPRGRPRRRDPGLQRADRPAPLRPPAARPPDAGVPVPLPDHHRRQRQHRPHARGGARACPTTCRACASCTCRRRVAAARCAPSGRTSDAPVLAYMDVDLSTDLDGLLPLVAPLISGHSDVAIGSRLARGARVVRGPKREFISRCYNLILRTRAAGPVQRRAVRVQSRPPRRRAAAASAGRGHRLVLRHRAAGARRAGRDADPRGARRLGRRPGLDGRHRGDGDGRPQGCAAHAGWLRERADPVAQIRAGLGHGRLAAAARPAAA